MITCPACGKENEDSAFECKRCRAPLRDEPHEEHHEAALPPAEEAAASSDSLGEVCRRCEAYNEPGVRACTNCGYQLFAENAASVDSTPADSAPAEEPPLDQTPPQAYAPVHPDGSSLSEELSALALSDEEAAEAGVSTNGHAGDPLDKTPPQAYAPPIEPEPEPVAPSRTARVAEAAATAAGVAVGAAAGIAAAATRRAPASEPPAPPAAPAARAPEPAAAPAEKTCASCGAFNPPAAKFCFDCGTPFAKKSEAPRAAPPPPAAAAPVPAAKIAPVKMEPPPSIHIAEDLTDSTAESAPIADDALADHHAEELPSHEQPAEEFQAAAEEPPAEDQPVELPPEDAAPEELPLEAAAPEEVPPEEVPAEEPLPQEAVEAPAEEQAPPFQASLIVEKGASPGTAFMLGYLENTVGASGAHVELSEDPFAAPHAATVLFAEDHLVLRDEGSANGVFVKVRESAPIEAGDHFVAGERLFRFDGFQELAAPADGETPFLGAPRPQGAVIRVTEVLAGGRTGRTCHRSGPVIAIGKTGCDMNFPSDAVLAARHAEIRLSEDGTATLVDLGAAPSGVFMRVRAQQQQDLQAGDVVMVGDQQLRVEVG